MDTDTEVAQLSRAGDRIPDPTPGWPDGTRVRISRGGAAAGTYPGPPARARPTATTTAATTTATIVVCDRLRAVAESLAEYLRASPGLAVPGVATSADELRPLLDARRPRLLVLDATLACAAGASGPTGFAAAHRPDPPAAVESLVATVRRRHPETGILLIGASADTEAVGRALREGALGWVTVDAPASELVEAAHGVLRGEYRIAPTLLAAVLGAVTHAGAEPVGGGRTSGARTDAAPASAAGSGHSTHAGAIGRLSERERLVLCCLVGGMNRRDIAVRLGIAETTARTHIGRILIKLDAHSMVEAAAVGRRAGLSAVER